MARNHNRHFVISQTSVMSCRPSVAPLVASPGRRASSFVVAVSRGGRGDARGGRGDDGVCYHHVLINLTLFLRYPLAALRCYKLYCLWLARQRAYEGQRVEAAWGRSRDLSRTQHVGKGHAEGGDLPHRER